jgi:hypothetical protein
METPPEYFYPLYKNWERSTHSFLSKLARDYKKVQVKTDPYNTNLFLKNLIKSQKSKNWKPFLKIIVRQLRKGRLDLFEINKKGELLAYQKGIEDWAVFIQDKRLCLLVDKVLVKNVEYAGSKNQLVEFIVRYLLSQLLQDWKGPKIMFLTESLTAKKVRISKLNKLLGRWDFTNIFPE